MVNGARFRAKLADERIVCECGGSFLPRIASQEGCDVCRVMGRTYCIECSMSGERMVRSRVSYIKGPVAVDMLNTS